MNRTDEEFIVHILDGDTRSIDRLETGVRELGLPVRAFNSFGCFIESYDARRQGCLILDLTLPDMHGLAVQDFLNENDDPLPVIFFAASPDVSSAVRAIQNGAVGFISKHYGMDRLLGMIREVFTALRAGDGGALSRHCYAPPLGARLSADL